MTILSPLSSATYPHIQFLSPALHFPISSFAVSFYPTLFYAAQPTAPAALHKAILQNKPAQFPLRTLHLLSSLFYPAFSVPLFFSSLPATFSVFHVHFFTYPTHSEEPLAHPCTPFTFDHVFAFFSNISPCKSFPHSPHRSLSAQLYDTLLEPSLSEYFHKSNPCIHFHYLLALCHFFLAFDSSVPSFAIVVPFSVLYLHLSTISQRAKYSLAIQSHPSLFV